MNQQKRPFYSGLIHGIPIGLGYLAVSFTFGIMAVSSGLSVFQSVLISLTNLTSAGQFAGLGIITAGSSYLEMAAVQLVINLRYCLMSCSLSQKLDHKMPLFHRFLMAYGVTDEIFGVSVCHPGTLSPFYSYGLMSAAVPGWTLGTLLGALFRQSASGTAFKCPGRGPLWNVSGDHRTSGKRKQDPSGCGPALHDSQLCIYPDPGIKYHFIRI